MAVSMRHTKLKAEEAALLAGEIQKPSWESRNEGIHERVTFEDTIWGFDLAGGSFYKTPLRVTSVKPDSRAEKAGIRPGDKLKRINDIDTSTLTIQEAHDIIVASGIHLKISVTAPEDEEDAYFCYEDPLADGYDSDEERRREEERARKRRVHAKVSSFWSLQWPWVSRKRLIYRESNCFMVNSKYEEERREKYPPLPTLRYTDDIVHFEEENQKNQVPSLYDIKEKARKSRQNRSTNSEAGSGYTSENEEIDSRRSKTPTVNGKQHDVPNVVGENEGLVENKSQNNNVEESHDEIVDSIAVAKDEGDHNDLLSPIPESMEENNLEYERVNDNHIEDPNSNNDEINHEEDQIVENEDHIENGELIENGDHVADDHHDENGNDVVDDHIENTDENNDDSVIINGDINEDELINEVLSKNDSISRNEEDNILDSILSDEGQNLDNSDDNNER